MQSNLKSDDSQNGEIMLEAAMIMVPILVLVMCLLSLSFLFYEQALTTTIATEIAADIAKNYKYSKRDNNEMGSGTLSLEDIENGKLFSSSFAIGKIEKEYTILANNYAQKRIEAATLGFHTSDLNVECDIKRTGLGRAYVKVSVSRDTDFFLSDIWNFGSQGTTANITGFGGTAYAECVDLIGYASMINFTDYWTSVLTDKIEVLGAADKLIDSIKSLIEKGAEVLGK